jgi:hypothetical protein
MRRKFFTSLAAAALALVPLNAAVAETGAEIVVVHGVPGLTVDVLVDGAPALRNVNFGDVAKTTLPAGDYTFAVAAAGSLTPVLSIEASLGAGLSATIAAFLDADGAPTMRAFVNENGATGIQPFHLAAFGAVDILVGTTTVLGPVTNGQTARIDVPGGTTVRSVGIGAAPAGGVAAIALGDVTVPRNTLVLAYAIGPDAGETLPRVVTATTTVAGARAIPSGSGGLASSSVPAAVLGLMLLGSLLVATPAVAARQRR